MLLAFVDQGLQHLAFGREPETVVNQFGIFRHDAVFQMASTRVQRDLFDAAVCFQQDRAAGGFVNPARFHTDKAVFHQIQPPDAMRAADFVQAGQDRGGRHPHAVDRHSIARLKPDFDHLGLIRGLFGADRALIDIFGRFLRRVFQHFAFGRGVQQVRINAERRFAALVLGDRNLVRLGIFQQMGARQQRPFAPRGNHPQMGVQRQRRQFKPHLIVALAGRAMRHGIGPGFSRDFHQTLGNQRPRDGCAQQIQPFVQRVRAEHREHEIADKFLAHVLDMDVFRLDPQQNRLGACRLQLLALAQIGGKGDDLAAILVLQPFQDDRGVKAAGIGKDDFFGLGHGSASAGFASR